MAAGDIIVPSPIRRYAFVADAGCGAPPAVVEITYCQAATAAPTVSSRASLAADVSRVRCGDQRLGAGWRQERRENFSDAASLVDDIVHLVRAFKERRTGRVYGHAAIAVNFGERASLYHDHHGTRMNVPSGSCSRLKDQVSLQHIGRSLHVQNDVIVWVEALRQRYDLQRAHLAERQRRYQRGRGECPQAKPAAPPQAQRQAPHPAPEAKPKTPPKKQPPSEKDKQK